MSDILTKVFTFKAEQTQENVVKIEGYIAKYGNVDSQGDRFVPGVFAESVDKLKKSGRRLGMYWMHKYDMVIGGFTDFWEKEDGLWGVGEIIMEAPIAKQAGLAAQKGYVNALSIGAKALSWYKDDAGIRNITKAELKEGSVVSFPANEQALFSIAKYNEDLVNASSLAQLHDYMSLHGIKDEMQNVLIAKAYEIKSKHKNKSDGREALLESGETLQDGLKKALELTEKLKNLTKGLNA